MSPDAAVPTKPGVRAQVSPRPGGDDQNFQSPCPAPGTRVGLRQQPLAYCAKIWALRIHRKVLKSPFFVTQVLHGSSPGFPSAGQCRLPPPPNLGSEPRFLLGPAALTKIFKILLRPRGRGWGFGRALSTLCQSLGFKNPRESV